MLPVASAGWAPAVAVALVAATFARLGLDVGAAAWALVQVVFVGLAFHDLATRRIPNKVTVPGSLIAVGLRGVFDRSALLEVVAAGVLAFGCFLLLSIIMRGGIGMGDVKLAGMMGFLLGSAVVSALVIGVVAGGVGAVAMLLSSRASRTTAIAYGPYLAFGGAIAILFFDPVSLV